jgi:predicted nicotinamide N-methyase
MPGYQIKHERIAIRGGEALVIRSLLDRQQFSDPNGQAQRMGISSASWPLFGLAWPSGLQLAACMASRPIVVGEKILELGCGLALPSLVCHRLGADITASDCHPLAGDFLLENLALNQLGPMKYRHGDWAAAPPVHADDEALPLSVAGRFDLLIGSDLLYERDVSGALAGFIEQHAKARAQVWIVDPDRSNRPAFNRLMFEQGFDLKESRLDQAATEDAQAYKGRLLVYQRAGA